MLRNVPVSVSLELLKTLNRALKGIREANSSTYRSKLLQPSEINHVV